MESTREEQKETSCAAAAQRERMKMITEAVEFGEEGHTIMVKMREDITRDCSELILGLLTPKLDLFNDELSSFGGVMNTVRNNIEQGSDPEDELNTWLKEFNVAFLQALEATKSFSLEATKLFNSEFEQAITRGTASALAQALEEKREAPAQAEAKGGGSLPSASAKVNSVELAHKVMSAALKIIEEVVGQLKAGQITVEADTAVFAANTAAEMITRARTELEKEGEHEEQQGLTLNNLDELSKTLGMLEALSIQSLSFAKNIQALAQREVNMIVAASAACRDFQCRERDHATPVEGEETAPLCQHYLEELRSIPRVVRQPPIIGAQEDFLRDLANGVIGHSVIGR